MQSERVTRSSAWRPEDPPQVEGEEGKEGRGRRQMNAISMLKRAIYMQGGRGVQRGVWGEFLHEMANAHQLMCRASTPRPAVETQERPSAV